MKNFMSCGDKSFNVDISYLFITYIDYILIYLEVLLIHLAKSAIDTPGKDAISVHVNDNECRYKSCSRDTINRGLPLWDVCSKGEW